MQARTQETWKEHSGVTCKKMRPCKLHTCWVWVDIHTCDIGYDVYHTSSSEKLC